MGAGAPVDSELAVTHTADMGPATPDDDKKGPKKPDGGDEKSGGKDAGGAKSDQTGGPLDLTQFGFGPKLGGDGATSAGMGQAGRAKPGPIKSLFFPDPDLLPGGPPVTEDAIALWRKFGREPFTADELDRLVEYTKLTNTYEEWQQASRRVSREKHAGEAESN